MQWDGRPRTRCGSASSGMLAAAIRGRRMAGQPFPRHQCAACCLVQVPILFSSLGAGDDGALLNAVREGAASCYEGAGAGAAWRQLEMGWRRADAPRRRQAPGRSPPHPLPGCTFFPSCLPQVIIGGVNLVSTGVAIYFVDRLGRRALFMQGGCSVHG